MNMIENPVVTMHFSCSHLILIRNGLKLLIQNSPRNERGELSLVLNDVDYHITMLCQEHDKTSSKKD